MYARALELNLRIALWPVLAGLLGACGTIE